VSKTSVRKQCRKKNMCRVVLFPPSLPFQADICDLVEKIGLLQRLHVVIFKCREQPNVAFIFPSDKLPIAGFTYRTL